MTRDQLMRLSFDELQTEIERLHRTIRSCIAAMVLAQHSKRPIDWTAMIADLENIINQQPGNK